MKNSERALPAVDLRKLRAPLRLCILLATCLSLSACLYTNVKGPLDTNVDSTQLGTKVGTASARSFLFLFATGDASTEAAATDGGITTITHLDAEQEIILFGLYTKTTTIAYGD